MKKPGTSKDLPTIYVHLLLFRTTILSRAPFTEKKTYIKNKIENAKNDLCTVHHGCKNIKKTFSKKARKKKASNNLEVKSYRHIRKTMEIVSIRTIYKRMPEYVLENFGEDAHLSHLYLATERKIHRGANLRRVS